MSPLHPEVGAFAWLQMTGAILACRTLIPLLHVLIVVVVYLCQHLLAAYVVAALSLSLLTLYALVHILSNAGHYSLVGSDVAWESRGTAIDPRFWHIFS